MYNGTMRQLHSCTCYPYHMSPVIHGGKVEFYHCDMIKRNSVLLFSSTQHHRELKYYPLHWILADMRHLWNSLRPSFMWGIQNHHCGYVSGSSFLQALTTNIVVSPLILIWSLFEQRRCHQSYLQMWSQTSYVV